MSSSARQQPPWQTPPEPDQNAQLPPLKVWNSLTRSKTDFVPLAWHKKEVSWYVCGPTVYDDAHLGHARNYVTTDIIRRILRDYFGYDVKFVMNITDVDDKIILRGRQQHLLSQFILEQGKSQSTILETALPALAAYTSKNLPQIPPDTEPEDVEAMIESKYGNVIAGEALEGGPPGDKEAKIKMHCKTFSSAAQAIMLLRQNKITLDDFYSNAQDILLPFLDHLHGSSINAEDHSVFTKLTQNFESRFMEDVRALNCLDPTEITRVTEYGQQIVEYVEKIQKNGFAYATQDGSVYFDIEAFEAADNHYARLEPWNRNDSSLLADGEGALTNNSTKKKSDADFALWKASKPGEPSWPSPWGKGRPGWHIECSAMASDKLGNQMDIHSGGVDLAFPHHDNELAQSEAFWYDQSRQHQHQWVNYFLHMGHLSIQGSKMSKSLKNFTTIREALSRGDWTPRGLRIVFLLGAWKDGIEITDDVVKAGSAWEEKVNNFFIKVNDIVDNRPESKNSNSLASSSDNISQTRLAQHYIYIHKSQSRGKINGAEGELGLALTKASEETYAALCDSFNTSLTMATISELISAFNTVDKSLVETNAVKDVGRWVTLMINILGLNGKAGPHPEPIGWSGISIPDAARPYIYPLSKARDELRRKARSAEGITPADLDIANNINAAIEDRANDEGAAYAHIASEFFKYTLQLASSSSLSKDVLKLCDRLRDVDLWDRGIYLEDRDGNQPALVRPVTKELLTARKEKEERELQKQKAKEEREREAAAKADKGRFSHLDMFRTSEYSAWDERGLPLKDAQGGEVTKSKQKKLNKDWERQKKLHEVWLKTQST